MKQLWSLEYIYILKIATALQVSLKWFSYHAATAEFLKIVLLPHLSTFKKIKIDLSIFQTPHQYYFFGALQILADLYKVISSEIIFFLFFSALHYAFQRFFIHNFLSLYIHSCPNVHVPNSCKQGTSCTTTVGIAQAVPLKKAAKG